MLRVTLTTDSWHLIFISSSPLVERGLGFLLKMPFLNLASITMDKKRSTQDTIRLIRKVRQLQDKLCDVTTNCSACFGVPVVFVMVHSLTCQLVVMYAFIRVLAHQYGGTELSDTIYYIVGSSLYALLPTFSIALAGELRKSCITTWKRVHGLINKASSTEIEDELQWLSEQMSHRMPSIDLQWFDVDWPIYVKACSELATYLIIMIQFESKL
ncbi:uncharacterized protein LOC126571852 [Anopheles aquasalis]|uniref:uncharacterized protein LOC126571852 n=1 Tax=Anopheles aquasalis TaxID=42839 RepID=UPI00215AA971|nr:uncharacterized protein LOC126571852 [Anopheles aquasalis]